MQRYGCGSTACAAFVLLCVLCAPFGAQSQKEVGPPVWETHLRNPLIVNDEPVYTRSAMCTPTIYVVSDSNKTFYGIDTTGGRILWTSNICEGAGMISGFAVAGSFMFAKCQRRLFGVNCSSGWERWAAVVDEDDEPMAQGDQVQIVNGNVLLVLKNLQLYSPLGELLGVAEDARNAALVQQADEEDRLLVEHYTSDMVRMVDVINASDTFPTLWNVSLEVSSRFASIPHQGVLISDYDKANNAVRLTLHDGLTGKEVWHSHLPRSYSRKEIFGMRACGGYIAAVAWRDDGLFMDGLLTNGSQLWEHRMISATQNYFGCYHSTFLFLGAGSWYLTSVNAQTGVAKEQHMTSNPHGIVLQAPPSRDFVLIPNPAGFVSLNATDFSLSLFSQTLLGAEAMSFQLDDHALHLILGYGAQGTIASFRI